MNGRNVLDDTNGAQPISGKNFPNSLGEAEQIGEYRGTMHEDIYIYIYIIVYQGQIKNFSELQLADTSDNDSFSENRLCGLPVKLQSC